MNSTSHEEFLERAGSRRAKRLLSLFVAYLIGLVIIRVVADGPTIGTILVALFIHAALNVPRAVLA